MPLPLSERIEHALDVSGAFDNCFFYSYALHLLTNARPFPEDFFTFESILGPDSHASKLQRKFQSLEALSVFHDYYQRKNLPEPFPQFLVEKTLVLGFMLREWFATKMLSLPQQDALLGKIIDQFGACKYAITAGVPKELVISQSLKISANLNFLDYFVARPKADLSEEEARYETYFAHREESDAIREFWCQEGYKNYCYLLAQSLTKLAIEDVVPVLEQIGQPLSIYDASTHLELVAIQRSPDEIYPLELKLHSVIGHYHLLRTDETTVMLDEYARSYEHYKTDRRQILEEIPENRLSASAQVSSLFVQSICPSDPILPDPFELLLSKIDEIQQFIRDFDLSPQALVLVQPPIVNRHNLERIFQQLDSDICNLDVHQVGEARGVADLMMRNLRAAQADFVAHINQPHLDLRQSERLFLQECENAVVHARPMLEKELGWGEYLINLLKKLYNAIVGIFTSNPHVFFKFGPASSREESEQVHAIGLA